MRKKILIFGHNDATQFIDVYNQYTRLFDPAKYEVTTAYLTGEPNEAVRARTQAEKVLFLNIPKRQIRGLKITAIRQLLSLCRQNQYEIVICHRFKPTYIMLWVAQFQKIPVLLFVMHELKTFSALGRRLLLYILGRQNMLLAGVSNAVRDDLRQALPSFPKERIVTLYNVLDLEQAEPLLLSKEEARQYFKLHPQDFIFGNLARLAKNKDQHTLIQAFATIKPACPHAKLVIAGVGSLETTLKAQVAELGLEKEVIFTGFVANGQRYMKAFDCFVLSSTQEAFGRVLLEAMAAKLPIIATQVNGIPEVLGQTNTLIPPKDIHACASALQTIYDTSPALRQQKGEDSYSHLKAHFIIPCFFTVFWQLPLLQSLEKSHENCVHHHL